MTITSRDDHQQYQQLQPARTKRTAIGKQHPTALQTPQILPSPPQGKHTPTKQVD